MLRKFCPSRRARVLTTISDSLSCVVVISWLNPSVTIEINQKSDSVSAPLKLMSSRMSPRASHRRHQYAILASSPGSFYRRLFSYIGLYKYKTSAFVTGKCRFKVKCAGGTSQNGVLMAYFGHSHWRKGDKFSRESDFWLICILCLNQDHHDYIYRWPRYPQKCVFPQSLSMEIRKMFPFFKQKWVCLHLPRFG